MKQTIVLIFILLGAVGGFFVARGLVNLFKGAGATMVTISDVFGAYLLAILVCGFIGWMIGMILTQRMR